MYPVLGESTCAANGDWMHKCGTVLLGARVHHPVWDSRFSCAGSGDVRVETVPYCPKCQAKPSASGAPVYV